MLPGYKRPSEKSTAEAKGESGALSRQPALLRGILPKAFQVHTLSLLVMTTTCRLCSLTSPTPSQHEGEHLAALLSAHKKKKWKPRVFTQGDPTRGAESVSIFPLCCERAPPWTGDSWHTFCRRLASFCVARPWRVRAMLSGKSPPKLECSPLCY